MSAAKQLSRRLWVWGRVVTSVRAVLAGLLVLGVVFAVIESVWPANPHQPRWRLDTKTDLAYWLFTPLVTKTITRAVLFVALAGLALAFGKPWVWALLHPTGPVSRQPA
jgi:hypothetical protein